MTPEQHRQQQEVFKGPICDSCSIFKTVISVSLRSRLTIVSRGIEHLFNGQHGLWGWGFKSGFR